MLKWLFRPKCAMCGLKIKGPTYEAKRLTLALKPLCKPCFDQLVQSEHRLPVSSQATISRASMPAILERHFRNGYIRDEDFRTLEPHLAADLLCEVISATHLTPPTQFMKYLEQHGDIRCYRAIIDQIEKELREAVGDANERYVGHASSFENVAKCKGVLIALFDKLRPAMMPEDLRRLSLLPPSYPEQKKRITGNTMLVYWESTGSLQELRDLAAAGHT